MESLPTYHFEEAVDTNARNHAAATIAALLQNPTIARGVMAAALDRHLDVPASQSMTDEAAALLDEVETLVQSGTLQAMRFSSSSMSGSEIVSAAGEAQANASLIGALAQFVLVSSRTQDQE